MSKYEARRDRARPRFTTDICASDIRAIGSRFAASGRISDSGFGVLGCEVAGLGEWTGSTFRMVITTALRMTVRAL